jgi:hypothetical protein
MFKSRVFRLKFLISFSFTSAEFILFVINRVVILSLEVEAVDLT